MIIGFLLLEMRLRANAARWDVTRHLDFEELVRNTRLARVDRARWQRRKARFVQRIRRSAAALMPALGATHVCGISNSSCAFLLSTGATASNFSAATPP
jgi:hypothetical protein